MTGPDATVLRDPVMPNVAWISIGSYDGYLRAVLESRADGRNLWSCGHRHPGSMRAWDCALKRLRRDRSVA